MKKFIIKSSLFVVVFFVVSFLLQEMIFWGINLISVGEFGVLNKIEHGEINAEILTVEYYKSITEGKNSERN